VADGGDADFLVGRNDRMQVLNLKEGEKEYFRMPEGEYEQQQGAWSREEE
jgi:hypothetical protein